MPTPSKPSPCVGIRTCSDYSPFGVELDGRTVSGGYRFGYQGSEKDNEFKGDGNSYTTEFRQLDPRLGRWLSVDPLGAYFHHINPYNYALNSPIVYFDQGGQYPIEIHVRSFAPFNWFGPFYLFKGDNRGFSTSKNATSRISQVTKYETTKMSSKTTPHGGASMTKYGAKAYSDAEIEFDQSYRNRIYTHLQGDDDALVPFVDWDYLNPSHDIDVWTDININVINNKDGSSILTLKGMVSGDGFPSTEAFVSDSKGNSIFIGVGKAKAGEIVGPTYTIAGDKKQKQFDVNIKIAVDSKGVFQGVYTKDKQGNEQIISIKEWNKLYENKDAK